MRWLVLLLCLWPMLGHADEGDVGDDDDSAADEPGPSPEELESAAAAAAETAAKLAAAEARTATIEAELEALRKQVARIDRKVNPKRPKIRIPTLDLQLGGRVSSDLRFRVQEKTVGDWYDQTVLPIGVSRLENIAKLTADASISKFRGYVELDFVLRGDRPDLNGFAGLTDQSQVVPTRFESQGAYIQARDLLAPGLDFSVGHMLVQWGVGDQFNPTNNLNANDLEDPLYFGQQQANLMLKVDYTLLNTVTFSGVVVPLFRPAMLPETAVLGLAQTDLLPYVDEDLRLRVQASNSLALRTGSPVIVDSIEIREPEYTPENMQFAFRVAATLGMQDLAISYYNGRSDFPTPTLTVNTIVDSPRCENDPRPPTPRAVDENGDPIFGTDEECYDEHVSSANVLEYPKLQVIGFNAAGEIPGINVGYRLELGIYIPQRMTGQIFKPTVALDPTPPGQFDYDGDGAAGGDLPVVVSDQVFAKWSLGFDRKLGPVILNAMWVHGLSDEFGAGDWTTPGAKIRRGWTEEAILEEAALIEAPPYPSLFDCATGGTEMARLCGREITRPSLADYLVFGVDINFLRDKGLIRIFTIWDLSGYTYTLWDPASNERQSTHYHPFTPEGFSATIYPEFQFNFGHGFEVAAGALILLGRDYTKFGDPAGGGSQVYFRARYSF